MALESLANEYVIVERIIERLSIRYDQAILEALLRVPMLTKKALESGASFDEWLANLKSELLDSADATDQEKGQSFSISHKVEDGLNVLEIHRKRHNNEEITVFDTDFFTSNEYRKIGELSDKLLGLLGNGAYVTKGDKKKSVNNFTEAMEWLLGHGKKGLNIQRYKGLGEMNPEQLWETTMNPETRRLLQVQIEDAIRADEIFTMLMGDHVEPRRVFIEDNALSVANLDV